MKILFFTAFAVYALAVILEFTGTAFKKEKLFKTGRDFVAGCYRSYPKQSAKAESWTEKVLAEQRVAVFGNP
jgi:predicted butyrate kinase (DUF1464 family)